MSEIAIFRQQGLLSKTGVYTHNEIGAIISQNKGGHHVLDRKDGFSDVRILRRNIPSVGGRAARCHVLERRRDVLGQFQGLGTHFRRDLAGFLRVGLARHNSPIPSEVSTPPPMTVANRRLHSLTQRGRAWRPFLVSACNLYR